MQLFIVLMQTFAIFYSITLCLYVQYLEKIKDLHIFGINR